MQGTVTFSTLRLKITILCWIKLSLQGVFIPFELENNMLPSFIERWQLRQLCRDSGAKVSFDTTNTRDSFYRAAIQVVMSSCSRLRRAHLHPGHNFDSLR